MRVQGLEPEDHDGGTYLVVPGHRECERLLRWHKNPGPSVEPEVEHLGCRGLGSYQGLGEFRILRFRVFGFGIWI